MDQENTPTRKTLWIFAVIGVLIYALIPVIWIASLSLKTPESIGDGSFAGLYQKNSSARRNSSSSQSRRRTR